MQLIKSLVVAFALLWSVPAHAQFGIGGVQPVIDVFAELQWPIQLERMLAQLDDMLIQAGIGSVPWNATTDPLLQEMGASGQGGLGIMYSDDIDGEWAETYTGNDVIDDGNWLEYWGFRGWTSLETQRKMLNLVHMQHDSFEADNARIIELQLTVDRAIGRNQLIKAQAALDAEKLRQQQMDRQIQMTLANIQVADNADRVNERFKREAYQHAFVANFDREPEPVVFQEWGL